MGEIRACVCVFVSGCGQGEKVLRSFPGGVCSWGGWQAQILEPVHVWAWVCAPWRHGRGKQEKNMGKMGRTNPAWCPAICISLREASVTTVESSVLKVGIAQRCCLHASPHIYISYTPHIHISGQATMGKRSLETDTENFLLSNRPV